MQCLHLGKVTAFASTQLDQRGNAGSRWHQAQLRVEQIPFPAEGSVVDEGRVFGLVQHQLAMGLTAQHLLGRDMAQQVVWVGDPLSSGFPTRVCLGTFQVLLRTLNDQRLVELLLLGCHEGRTCWRAKQPVFNHWVFRVLGETFQIKADELGRTSGRQHPVQRAGQQNAGIQPEASMACNQIQADPVGLLGGG